MERTIKELPVTNGTLYATSGGTRQRLATFDGRVEIVERQTMVPILGAVHKGTKRIRASFIVCGSVDYEVAADDRLIHDGKAYSATADVGGRSFSFDSLRFEDSDSVSNELVFEIADCELVERLLGM